MQQQNSDKPNPDELLSGRISEFKSIEELPSLHHPGAIDADGHVLEPPDLWERYIDKKYRSRALTLVKADDGTEFLQIDGRPSKLVRGLMTAGLGAMDFMGGYLFEREKTGSGYLDNAPFGSMDPQERLRRLDIENIERAVLYPTLNILWIAEAEDEDLTQAHMRAYNRWIVDFCADSGGRLLPVAQLSLGDPVAAEQELKRAHADGVIGVFVPPFTLTRKSLGHPDHARVFALAAELGMPLGLHPSLEPKWAAPGRFGEMTSSRYSFFNNVVAPDAIRHAFTSLFLYGIFESHPDLRVVVLESGAGWIGYWLDRMDTVYESPQGFRVRRVLPELPSHYFARQCWISGDPDEKTLSAIIPVVGEDKFFWASDFPHPDHPPTYIAEVDRLAAELAPEARKKFLGLNVKRAYNLED